MQTGTPDAMQQRSTTGSLYSGPGRVEAVVLSRALHIAAPGVPYVVTIPFLTFTIPREGQEADGYLTITVRFIVCEIAPLVAVTATS